MISVCSLDSAEVWSLKEAHTALVRSRLLGGPRPGIIHPLLAFQTRPVFRACLFWDIQVTASQMQHVRQSPDGA